MTEPGIDRRAYLGRIYDKRRQAYACRATSLAEFEAWQEDARPALCSLIGLDRIQSSLGDHEPAVALGPAEDMGSYTRQLGHLHSEPGVVIPFWLLVPKGEGPFPLGLFPHGHEPHGMNTHVGIWDSDEKRQRIEREDRDVAVQAVRRGFVAIAPTTRGFAPAALPDVTGRHGNRDCRSQLVHCLLAGRTAIGERVWDLQRLLDWACARPDVDPRRVLMMGNSGGGVATLYTAACDPRITIAVPSCSFCTLVSHEGHVHHCDCNTVPGILGWGCMHDVSGLIAPRYLLIVNGREDALFSVPEVDRAVAGVRRIYRTARADDRFAHRYGDGGHRFYKALMWPFIEQASSDLAPRSESAASV
ncbi:MAG: dienelactone hydrolase family protein [Anaerolineae bacterium]